MTDEEFHAELDKMTISERCEKAIHRFEYEDAECVVVYARTQEEENEIKKTE